MRVRVRLFAIQRELAGTKALTLDLAPGATIEDAMRVSGWNSDFRPYV